MNRLISNGRPFNTKKVYSLVQNTPLIALTIKLWDNIVV